MCKISYKCLYNIASSTNLLKILTLFNNFNMGCKTNVPTTGYCSSLYCWMLPHILEAARNEKKTAHEKLYFFEKKMSKRL